MKAKVGVSVILCCFNSSFRLQKTLEHLALQQVADDVLWEIILVNNNSTDDTKEKATRIWQSLENNTDFRIVDQPVPGLSNARQKGVTIAQFDMLLFCDDDNWLEENYVQRAYSMLLENKNVGILAGWSEAYFEKPPPPWFSLVQAAYAVGKPMPMSGLANSRQYLPGAGFIVRSALFTALNTCSFQHLLTGRNKLSLSSGEDTELCILARFLGYDLYFDDQLFFMHFMPSQRLKWQYCINLVKAHATTEIYFYLYSYCFHVITAGSNPGFNNAWKIFIKKHSKNFLKDFIGLKKAYHTFREVVQKKEGSMKILMVQKKLAKLKFALNNKNKLEEEFKNMFQLAQRLQAYKRMHPVNAGNQDFEV